MRLWLRKCCAKIKPLTWFSTSYSSFSFLFGHLNTFPLPKHTAICGYRLNDAAHPTTDRPNLNTHHPKCPLMMHSTSSSPSSASPITRKPRQKPGFSRTKNQNLWNLFVVENQLHPPPLKKENCCKNTIFFNSTILLNKKIIFFLPIFLTKWISMFIFAS